MSHLWNKSVAVALFVAIISMAGLASMPSDGPEPGRSPGPEGPAGTAFRAPAQAGGVPPADGSQGLSRFGSLLTDAVVDAHLYNTSSDTYTGDWKDGGASSWAAFGSFPDVAFVIATANYLTIYNAQTEAEWMRFTYGPNNAVGPGTTSVHASEGLISVGTEGGLYVVDFPNDAVYHANASALWTYAGDIAARNGDVGWDTPVNDSGIIDDGVLDVHTNVNEGSGNHHWAVVGTRVGLTVIDLGTRSSPGFSPYNITSNDHAVSAVFISSDGTLYQAGERPGKTDVYLAALYDITAVETENGTMAADSKVPVWTAFYNNIGGGDPQATSPALEPPNKLEEIHTIHVSEGSGSSSGDNLILLGTDIGFNRISEKRATRVDADSSSEDVVSYSTKTTNSVVDYETMRGSSETVFGMAFDSDRNIVFSGSGDASTAGAVTLIDLASGFALEHFDTGTITSIPAGNVTSISIDVGILLAGTSGGAVLLDVNQPPELLSGGVPADQFTVEEDSPQWMEPEDLRGYFTDDYDADDLNFTMGTEEDDGVVDGKIVDDYYFTAIPVEEDFYGTMNFTVEVTDTGGKSIESNNFSVVVEPANDPPHFVSVGTTMYTPGLEFSFEAQEGMLFEAVAVAFDIDGDAVTYATDLPEAQYPDIIDPVSGNITYLGANEDVGVLEFLLIADDGNGSTTGVNVSIEVTNANSLPAISSLDGKVPGLDDLDDFRATQGRLFNMTVVGSDPDIDIGEDDTLTFTAEVANFTPYIPAAGDIMGIEEFLEEPEPPVIEVIPVDRLTSLIQFVPDNGQVRGTMVITVEVMDNSTEVSDSANFTVTVDNSNDVPIIKRLVPLDAEGTAVELGPDIVPTVTMYEDDTAEYGILVYDPDEGVGYSEEHTFDFAYADTANDTGIQTLDVDTNGILSLTPTDEEVGVHEIILKVQDSYGGVGEEVSFQLSVLNVNDPPDDPHITSPGHGAILRTTTVEFTMRNASDVDTPQGDLTYSWDFGDGTVVPFDPAADGYTISHVFTLGPGLNQEKFNVTLTASDGEFDAWHMISVTIDIPPATGDGGDGEGGDGKEGGLSLTLIIIIIIIVAVVGCIAGIAVATKARRNKEMEEDIKRMEEQAAEKAAQEEEEAARAAEAARKEEAAKAAAGAEAEAAPAAAPGVPGAGAPAPPEEAIDIPADILAAGAAPAVPGAAEQAALPPGAAPPGEPEPTAAPPETPLGAGEEEMFQCGACGQLIPATSTVCPHCGASFEEDGEEMSQCGACGQVIPADAPMCPHCGASFTDDAGADVPMAAPVDEAMPPIEDVAASIAAGVPEPPTTTPQVRPPPTGDFGDMLEPSGPEAPAAPPPQPPAPQPEDDLGDMFAPITEDAKPDKKKKDDEFGDLFGNI